MDMMIVVGNTCMESPIVRAHFLNQGKQTTNDTEASLLYLLDLCGWSKLNHSKVFVDNFVVGPRNPIKGDIQTDRQGGAGDKN